MQRKIVTVLLSLGIGWSPMVADVSEMIFYPQADFTEGLFHFNYQGTQHKNYGFMFEKGFDPSRIVYVRPENNKIEKQSDGSLKLSFADTDRYSYVQRAYKDDFLVSETNGVYTILLSGGDCKSSTDCVTAENILTVNVPKGYNVRKYEGLDNDLKPLKNPKWQIKGNTYILSASDVKGACVMMEIVREKGGIASKPVVASTVAEKIPTTPSVAKIFESAAIPNKTGPSPKAAEPMPTQIVTASPSKTTVLKAPAVIKEPVVQEPQPSAFAEPAPYFRNFQLFDNRIVALNEAGKERLIEWAKLFKTSGKKMIIINAYTDDIPPQRLKHLYATNEIISEARGKAVADFLATQGINPKIITVNGMGDADPVASNETEEGRSKNRRIEFVLN